jgi:hypothetical protein
MKSAVIIALLLTSPGICLAQAESKLVKVEGVDGIWFPMPKAKSLLKDVKLLPKVQLQLSRVEDRLELEKRYTVILKLDLKDTEKISDLWKQTATAQAKLLAKKSTDPWWKNPYLWTAVGFVIGVGATVGIAVAIDRSGVTR